MKSWFSILLIHLMTTHVYAQSHTLFIDINLSKNEGRTVENWSLSNGVVFDLIPSNAKYLWNLKTRSDNYGRAMEKASLNEHADLYVKKIEIDREIMANLKSAISETDQYLSQLESSGEKLTTLIISGHHSTDGSWYGGGVLMSEGLPTGYLQSLVNTHPSIAQTVQTIILAGCFSATQPEIIDALKAFPKVTVIAGYSGKGYLDEDTEGSTYIKNALSLSKAVRAGINEDQLQAALKKMYAESPDKALGLYVRINQGAFIHNGLLGSKVFTPYQSPFLNCSLFNSDTLPGLIEKLNLYTQGNLIDITNKGRTDLLDIYTQFQNNQHCMADQLGKNTAQQLKNKAFLMRFYTSVKQNFYQTYGLEWANLNQRYQINYRAIDDWTVNETKQVVNQLEQHPHDQEALHFIKVLKSQVLSFRCTPLSWHEFKENQTPESPLCE